MAETFQTSDHTPSDGMTRGAGALSAPRRAEPVRPSRPTLDWFSTPDHRHDDAGGRHDGTHADELPTGRLAEGRTRRPSSYLDDGAQDGRLQQVGDGWAAVVAQMEEDDLRALVVSLPLIEQAKGVLMGYYGIGPDRAFTILRRWSSVHHVKIRDLARVLVERTDADPPNRAESAGSAARWTPFDAVRRFLDDSRLA